MQFIDFKTHLEPYLIFSIRDIDKLYPHFNKMNLVNWQKKGYIQKIRNSWYYFTDFKLNEETLYCIANRIYSPSYISLESAFSYYGVIPEAVFNTTLVTTNKTLLIQTPIHNFTYKKIKPNLFFGYSLVPENGFVYKMAELEKALLDYLYLKASVITMDDIDGLRFNKIVLKQQLNRQKLVNYALFLNSKTVLDKTQLIISYIYD